MSENDELRVLSRLMATFVIAALVGIFLCAGCATPQGGNPSDIEVELENANSNVVTSVLIVSPNMGDFDALRDLIPGDILSDLLAKAVAGGASAEDIKTILDLLGDPEQQNGNETTEGDENANDSGGSGETNGESTGNGGDPNGSQSMLWKSKYDADTSKPLESGTGVLLIPAALPDPASAALSVGGKLIPASRISRNGHNGNRPHIRFTDEYPRGAGVVDVLWPNGDSKQFPIPDTHDRHPPE